jgi:hypothetical protein
MATRHLNNGKCEKCAAIFDAYPDFDASLREWFEVIQEAVPECHISCAGRGKEAQEKALKDGASRAHYGESAHNYNAAIDIFRLDEKLHACWEYRWIVEKIVPQLPTWVRWYGVREGKRDFIEAAHFERRGWKNMGLTRVE